MSIWYLLGPYKDVFFEMKGRLDKTGLLTLLWCNLFLKKCFFCLKKYGCYIHVPSRPQGNTIRICSIQKVKMTIKTINCTNYITKWYSCSVINIKDWTFPSKGNTIADNLTELHILNTLYLHPKAVCKSYTCT